MNVAVVIPAADAADTIDAALASLATQTVAPAAVVVADDSSTDSTPALVAAWVDRLPLTMVTTDGRAGPSAARALAIESVDSPLLGLLDADDVWTPGHLETMVAAYRTPDDLVMADRVNWSPGYAPGTLWSKRHPMPGGNGLHALYRDNYINSSVLFSRALYGAAGGFRRDLWVGEDWDLWIRMLRAGARVVPTQRATVQYRVGATSLTTSERAGDDRVAVLEYARREALDDDERQAALVGLRIVRAEQSLWRAYRAAPSDPWQARKAGAHALTGRRRVAVRGAAMVVAPRFTARRKARAAADIRTRLNS
jgi:glycosyltransferase involved in cell wall biosynthesis